MSDSQFHFKNCQIESGLERHALAVLRGIVELSPLDATVVALLEKVDGGYWCSMDIYSHSGAFVSRCFAWDARESIDGLALKMRVKLSQWNRGRPRDRSFYVA